MEHNWLTALTAAYRLPHDVCLETVLPDGLLPANDWAEWSTMAAPSYEIQDCFFMSNFDLGDSHQPCWNFWNTVTVGNSFYPITFRYLSPFAGVRPASYSLSPDKSFAHLSPSCLHIWIHTECSLFSSSSWMGHTNIQPNAHLRHKLILILDPFIWFYSTSNQIITG